jgi:hypothetical protein
MVRSYEQDNETSDMINTGNFSLQLDNSKFTKKNYHALAEIGFMCTFSSHLKTGKSMTLF